MLTGAKKGDAEADSLNDSLMPLHQRYVLLCMFSQVYTQVESSTYASSFLDPKYYPMLS